MTGTITVRMTPQQRQADVIQALAWLAETRREPLSEPALLVYSSVLADCDLEDVRTACDELAREPRREFEPTFPVVGTIIERAEAARRRRTAPPVFTPCGVCMNGMAFVTRAGELWKDGMEMRDRYARSCACKREWEEARRRLAESCA